MCSSNATHTNRKKPLSQRYEFVESNESNRTSTLNEEVTRAGEWERDRKKEIKLFYWRIFFFSVGSTSSTWTISCVCVWGGFFHSAHEIIIFNLNFWTWRTEASNVHDPTHICNACEPYTMSISTQQRSATRTLLYHNGSQHYALAKTNENRI